MRTSLLRALIWTIACAVSIWSVDRVLSAQSSEPVYYYHTDWIGSVRMITNEQGQVVERHEYQPFGVEVSPPVSSERVRFAGKEHDTETGASGWIALGYFGARYLHSATGRFTSVDPIVVADLAITEPQLWNRYGYVRNNPHRYVDPDGRQVIRISTEMAERPARVEALVSATLADWIGEDAAGMLGALAGSLFDPTNVLPAAGSVQGPANAATRIIGRTAARTRNVSSGVLSHDAALRAAARWLGDKYDEIAEGVFRSTDRTRQFRMTISDLSDAKQGPHVHFESIAPDGRTIIENGHALLDP